MTLDHSVTSPYHFLSFKTGRIGAREVALWLRAHNALTDGLSSVPGTHLGGLRPYLTPVPEYRKPLASKGTGTHVHILTHTHLIKDNKNRS